jgi:hypothetical protein
MTQRAARVPRRHRSGHDPSRPLKPMLILGPISAGRRRWRARSHGRKRLRHARLPSSLLVTDREAKSQEPLGKLLVRASTAAEFGCEIIRCPMDCLWQQGHSKGRAATRGLAGERRATAGIGAATSGRGQSPTPPDDGELSRQGSPQRAVAKRRSSPTGRAWLSDWRSEVG